MLFKNIPPVSSQIVLQAKGLWDEYLQVHHNSWYLYFLSFPSRCADKLEYFNKKKLMQRKRILEYPHENLVPAGPSRPTCNYS